MVPGYAKGLLTSTRDVPNLLSLQDIRPPKKNTKYQCCGSRSAWIRNFFLDSELLFRIRIHQKKRDK